MADWGIRTWDANGIDNNTGLVRIFAVGTWTVTDQQTGSASFTIPAGYVMDYLFQSSMTTSPQHRRRVTISGGTISLSAIADGDFSAGSEPTSAGYFLLFMRSL